MLTTITNWMGWSYLKLWPRWTVRDPVTNLMNDFLLWPSDDHAHDSGDDWSVDINVFDVGEMIPYVDTILREDDKVTDN